MEKPVDQLQYHVPKKRRGYYKRINKSLPAEVTERYCLRCEKKFSSINGNRLCNICKRNKKLFSGENV